jgi:hypothetical protein
MHDSVCGKQCHFVPILSNKLFEFVGGKLPLRSSLRILLIVVSDSASTVGMILGQYRLPDDAGKSLAVKRLRWLSYLLTFRLPFKPVLDKEGILIHRERDVNFCRTLFVP